jgi:Flp pilus assembly protein TadG
MSNFANLSACQAVFSSMTTKADDPRFYNYVMNFLANPSNDPDVNGTNYNNLKNYLIEIASANTSGGKTCKILLALDDGTVIIDTSKPANNTIEKYADKQVNSDNHNTRPEIMNAVLNSSGVASALRFSSSSSSAFQYYAVRLGNSTQSNLGTIRIAFQA